MRTADGVVISPDTQDTRRAVALIADDLYVNVDAKDVMAHEDWRRAREPEPVVRRDETWNRYVFFLHVGEGLTTSSGFRYTGKKWKPRRPTRDTDNQLDAVLARIRDAGDPPLEDKWNAAVITYDRRTGTGRFHAFYGEDAERWYMTPANQEAIAEAGLDLFDENG